MLVVKIIFADDSNSCMKRTTRENQNHDKSGNTDGRIDFGRRKHRNNEIKCTSLTTNFSAERSKDLLIIRCFGVTLGK